MSQPSVTTFFTSRKRTATDQIRNKAKVLDNNDNVSSLAVQKKNVDRKINVMPKKSQIVNKAIQNLQFDDSPASTVPGKQSMVEVQKESETDVQESCSKLDSKQEEKIGSVVECGDLGLKKVASNGTDAEKAPTAEDEKLTEIKQKILGNSRLNEIRDRLDNFRKRDKRLREFEESESDKIDSETASPQKMNPNKRFKSSLTKVPAYQTFQADGDATNLPLPYNYRFLAEVFRSVDTISGMFFNRKETITYNKLKPSVQELLRRNFTVDHLAMIKTIYPGAFEFRQEKLRSFASFKQEQYELVLIPTFEKSTENKVDIMGPGIMLERRRFFYKTLLNLVKEEHKAFLLTLNPPMNIPEDKIIRWHPNFDINKCKEIEKAELPQPPIEKSISAKEILEQAKTLFDPNSRMEKAVQMLADGQAVQSEVVTNVTNNIPVSSSTEGTPTPKPSVLSSALKGIPPALLEKIRAKQAAKAREAMIRPPSATKEASKYARLPELSKIVRNIFVSERKGVLTLEAVIDKLRNSYRSNLTNNDLEEHIRLLCKLLPAWASVHNVRKVEYLKLAKDIDILKIVKRLEIMADQKL